MSSAIPPRLSVPILLQGAPSILSLGHGVAEKFARLLGEILTAVVYSTVLYCVVNICRTHQSITKSLHTAPYCKLAFDASHSTTSHHLTSQHSTWWHITQWLISSHDNTFIRLCMGQVRPPYSAAAHGVSVLSSDPCPRLQESSRRSKRSCRRGVYTLDNLFKWRTILKAELNVCLLAAAS